VESLSIGGSRQSRDAVAADDLGAEGVEVDQTLELVVGDVRGRQATVATATEGEEIVLGDLRHQT
jgi:hypothetical protein